MSDMTPVIEAKSDQLNAADLVGGPITVTITRVDVRDAKEQPVSVHYQGDDGKPWKPCKSMCRVMVAAWGPDSKTYPGKMLTLYCDPTVKWAGMEIGGIRISHMSHIDGALLTAVTLSKGSRKPYRVEPLQVSDRRADNGAREVADDLIRRAHAADGPDALRALAEREAIIKRRDWLRQEAPDIADEVDDAFRIAQPADTATPDNPTAQEGRSDEDMGEGFNDEAPAWRAVVDAHLDSIQKLETMIDVKGAVNQFAATKRGLPDDVIADIEAAENSALMRFSTAAAG
ncbi:hypothetical protein [Sphingopyxis sp. 550A]